MNNHQKQNVYVMVMFEKGDDLGYWKPNRLNPRVSKWSKKLNMKNCFTTTLPMFSCTK